jgi:hypothetical protein
LMPSAQAGVSDNFVRDMDWVDRDRDRGLGSAAAARWYRVPQNPVRRRLLIT